MRLRKPTPAKYECSYGKEAQLTSIDTSVILSEEQQKRIQRIVGSCLFYARSVDPTMICDTNRLSSHQACPTEATEAAADHLLKYAATYPVVKTVFRASDMILRISSDASYLTERGGKSRVGGYHDLIKASDDPLTAPINGAIVAISTLLSAVVSSVGEAEYGAVFMNGQVGADIRQKLIGMRYPQPTTTIITDNQCAAGIASKSIKQLRTKSIDMRFHWIRDRIVQHQFKVVWQHGIDNVADYFTKVHPTSHHRQRRHLYVQTVPIGRHITNTAPIQTWAKGVCCSKMNKRDNLLVYSPKIIDGDLNNEDKIIPGN